MPKLRPRVYNRHHGTAPTEAVYVGRGKHRNDEGELV